MQTVTYIASKTPINSGRQIFGTGNIYAEYVYPRNMNLIKKKYTRISFSAFYVVLLRFLSYHFDLNQGVTRNHGRKLILDLSITSSHVKDWINKLY